MITKKENKTKEKPLKTLEIIDFKTLQRFNTYYRFLRSYEAISTFSEMKKRSINELEKSTNKL